MEEELFDNHPISLEIKILIATSICSIIGLLIVYYFQKKGFLNHRFIHFVLLMFSIAFLFGASLLFYASNKTYLKRLEELKSFTVTEDKLFNNSSFNQDETSIYIDLKENRNLFLGYETFLNQSVINYQPSQYSYANVLKEELINNLSEKEGTQVYWDQILENVYEYDSINNYRHGQNYNIMWAISNKNYPNEDLGETTDEEIIYKTSVSEYWKRKLLEIDRNPDQIESYWRDNKAYLFTFFSKSKYDDYCKTIVDDLIAVKEKVNEQPNYKAFYEAYSISDPKFLTFPDVKFVKSYQYSWPFSFWDRRYEEKNDDIIYKILKEVQNHYQN